ncbi:uncharacterized protein LODBEIA_P51780 [Lodderomyces beijingensis]|uniref:PX domain-containing protein n=1 Tax=Lodderomyces beijingensis TaxID=1775926 RepID=A0ABP0ZST4_9ASCO
MLDATTSAQTPPVPSPPPSEPEPEPGVATSQGTRHEQEDPAKKNHNQSQPSLVRSSFEDEEDNNPFSHHSGLTSFIIQQSQSQKHQNDPDLDDAATATAAVSSHTQQHDYEDESMLLYKTDEHHHHHHQDKLAARTAQKPRAESFNTVSINFESRVTKLLKPKVRVKIHITEAGNSNEGMANASKKYVVYTIKLINLDKKNDEILTRRRYSDFESLRDILTKIFPLIIIPPIPPKNYFDFSVLNGLVGGGNGGVGGAGGAHTSNGNGFGSNGGSSGGSNHEQSTNGSSSASATAATTATAHSSSNSNSNSTPSSYAYINSSHLIGNKLIEHRKRLLANFLNNCLEIHQLRNLEFFAKFLDPNANWSDEIALIQSQLPKNTYLSNPENGLKTDPIYRHLPNPSNKKTMSFFKDNSKKLTKKTNQLISSGGGGAAATAAAGCVPDHANDMTAEPDHETLQKQKQDEFIVDTSGLDDMNKRIMANFMGLSNDYAELGSFFNSFSLIFSESVSSRSEDNKLKSSNENDDELNFIFDKIGQIFDRSYITINSLISELETRFSEPLGEAVQYTDILHYVTKYQAKKLKQKHMLESECKSKRKELDELLKIEAEAGKVEHMINSQHNGKQPPQYKLNGSNSVPRSAPNGASAEANTTTSPTTNHTSGSKFKFIPSFKKITQYVSEIIDQNPQQTRKTKIYELTDKIKIFEKCHDIMLADLSFIFDEVDKNLNKFHTRQLKMIYEILLYYNRFMINWARKNVEIWEEVRDEILKY